MAQQKISTPSVIEVLDTVIRSSSAYAYPEVGGIDVKDPWDSVLTKLEPYVLDPNTVVEALRASLANPEASNPYLTTSLYEKRFGTRGFILVGPAGSGADFEGSDGDTISAAISALGGIGGWVVLHPQVYSLQSTLTIPNHVRLFGIHPETTILRSDFDVVGVELQERALLSRVTVDGSNITTKASIIIGESSTVERCRILDFACLGVQLVGTNAKVVFSRFESSSTNNYATGASLQGTQQVIDACSFHGPLLGGVVQFESHEGGVLYSLFAEDNLGPCFSVPSPILNDNRIAGCHFASASALSLSIDQGTRTVRYGNTPGVLEANTNNFLDQLVIHTGQPDVTSNEMILSNSFTHDPSTDKDATIILGKIDEAVEQLYEERNLDIELPDPLFDYFGNTVSNFFSWDGSSNTFSWPDFILKSLHKVEAVANVSGGSLVVPPGYRCFLDFNTTAALATLETVPIDAPVSKKFLTLITALENEGQAIWRESIKLEASDISYFDADGHLLAPTRFFGVSSKNPGRETGLFSSFEKPNMTAQLGDQSSALALLYERDNLQYNRETEDTRISTEPTIGDWYGSAWSLGIPSAPTHLINIQGTLHGLVPSVGIFYFDRSADGWRPLSGCPLTGPYSSISRWATGLCLLSCSGEVVTYAPELGWGASLTPTKSTPLAALTLTSSGPSTPWYDAGQADFAMQTENYSLFTTVDGYSIRWYQDHNFLELLPRIYTEAAGSSLGLLSYHPKDTGYNMALGKEDLCMSGENGGFSRLSGLPLSTYYNAEILIDTNMLGRQDALRLDWSTLLIENFAVTQPNGDFIVVACNNARSTFYILAGGRGTARLVAILDSTSMPGFTPSAWVLDAIQQTTYVLGPSSTNELVCYKGSWSNPSLPSDQRWGAGQYLFTKITVQGPGRCSGVYAALDLYEERSGSGKVIALASDPSRANRPTWVEYNPKLNTWTINPLTDETPTDDATLQVSTAVANSCEAQATAGFGVASPYGMTFLIRSGSGYSSRPCVFRRSRATGQIQGYELGGNSIVQCLGGVYHPAFKAIMWLMRGSTGDQVRVYSLFESAQTPTVWSISTIGSGGTYLPGTALGTPSVQRRSASMISRSSNVVLGASATYDVYFWSTSRGLIKGSLGVGATGFSSQTWTLVNGRSNGTDPFVFSSTPANTYSCLVGVDRGGDLSLQFSSFVENIPTYGFSALSQPADYEGLIWFEPGPVVKNLGKSYLWAGLNRGGYLWFANARDKLTQIEFTPNTQIRGDVVIPNMAATTDFDWASTSDGSKIAFCMRNSANYLFFYLYDVATRAITLERQGLDFPNVALLSSTPKMSFNTTLNAFEIVAQDNTRSGGQLVFYRRYLNGTWLGEQVGSGSSNLTSLGSQACRLPCKPLVLDDGSFLVACESGNFAALVIRRDNVGWSIAWLSQEGGFATPALGRTKGQNPRFFVFGGTASGVRSAVGSSLSGISSWSYLVNPSAQSVSVYTRVKNPEVFMTDDLVYVASPLAVEAGTTDSQEFGVFTFSGAGEIKGSAFAAKGRLTQGQSGREEVGYTSHSWTHKGDLLYAATRPGRSQTHWNIRRSYNKWACCGDSVLGSGRIIALDNRQYRESFVSESQSDGLFVVDSSLRASSFLPLATRNETELWGLNWAARSQGPLFAYGKFESSITNDTSAPTGLLPALAQRAWPRIIGTTQGILSGASIFGSGSGLRLVGAVGTSNYFGTTLPSNGLFRLKTVCSLTFHGVHRFRLGHRDDREYVIQGPLTFPLLDAPGQTLVLDFATANSLKLDAPDAPLSYWAFGDISKYRYPIVLGRNEETDFILSPIIGHKRLTHGHLEPRETSDLGLVLDSREVEGNATHCRFSFEEITTGNYGSFKVKILGSNHGIQTIDMTNSAKKQLVVRGPLAGGFTFITLTMDEIRAVAPHLQPIVTSHSFGNIVILGH